jgi:hypothetical protein
LAGRPTCAVAKALRQPGGVDLEQLLWLGDVLEAVLAQGRAARRRPASRDRPGSRRGPRQQDLAAVPGARDARGAVHIDADQPYL